MSQEYRANYIAISKTRRDDEKIQVTAPGCELGYKYNDEEIMSFSKIYSPPVCTTTQRYSKLLLENSHNIIRLCYSLTNVGSHDCEGISGAGLRWSQ